MNKSDSAETRSERRRRDRQQTADSGQQLGVSRETPRALTPNTQHPTPNALSLLEWTGLGALWLALALAPAIGGYPAGATYGADTSLAVLRLLVILAGGILLAAVPPRSDSAGSAGLGRTAALALWATFGLTLLSLMIRSRFLTSDTLLFAMLPATLDWLCFAVIFVVALRYAAHPAARLGTLIALTLGAGWVALTAVDAYVGPLTLLAGADGDYRVGVVAWFIRLFEVMTTAPATRAQGAFFSPNFLAGFIALTLPVIIALQIAAPSKRFLWLYGVVSALSLAALFVTGSRSGIVLALVGLGIAFALYIFARGFQGLPWGRIGIVAAAIVILALAFRGPIFNRVAGAGGATQEHSGEFRSWTWRGTQAMAQANPFFGTGPGTFPYLYPRYSLVARTDLAHSSYLQTAAEQGFPALLAAGLALLGVFGAAGRSLRLMRDDAAKDSDATILLLSAAIGGILASILHNAFDSEWSLLGNALPFWAVAGISCGVFPTALRSVGKTPHFPLRALAGAGLTVAFVLGVILWRGAIYREEIVAAMKSPSAPTIVTTGWPPDPILFYSARKMEDTVRIEPTGKRFYQLARFYAGESKLPEAIEAMKKSLDAEPTALQSWRKLAELQRQSGNESGAMDAWRELIKRQEGPVGLYRAIPELPETHAAFAYAALADYAAKQGQNAEAQANLEKAAAVVEEYSNVNETYRQIEAANAQVTGVNLAARREELAALYRKVMTQWSGLAPEKAPSLNARRDAALSRLAAFDSTPMPAGMLTP